MQLPHAACGNENLLEAHAVELLDVRRFGELLLEREVGVEHRQVTVGLLVADRIAGEAVSGLS